MDNVDVNALFLFARISAFISTPSPRSSLTTTKLLPRRLRGFARASNPLDPDAPTPLLFHLCYRVADLIEGFAASKQSILGRFCRWILNDVREDQIDGFWMEDRRVLGGRYRSAIAEVLLRNLNHKNGFYFSMGFEDGRRLEENMEGCNSCSSSST